ncbi:MAG: cobalamin B12-binding domain-containing protein [Deltaproteobacteria bacterium]|nr:MAG: cobalamin B12-binding domain-containing protein [Deltaproteobacteria bacterium]
MKNNRKIRVLLSKLGFDGHERGVVMVAMALRDAGMEVIYLGKHKTVEQIVQSAIEEDVNIIGLSSLADAHRTLAPKVTKLLREKGSDIPVILGGFIQPEDIPLLKETGIAEVFGIGSRLEDIVKWVRDSARK